MGQLLSRNILKPTILEKHLMNDITVGDGDDKLRQMITQLLEKIHKQTQHTTSLPVVTKRKKS